MQHLVISVIDAGKLGAVRRFRSVIICSTSNPCECALKRNDEGQCLQSATPGYNVSNQRVEFVSFCNSDR